MSDQWHPREMTFLCPAISVLKEMQTHQVGAASEQRDAVRLFKPSRRPAGARPPLPERAPGERPASPEASGASLLCPAPFGHRLYRAAWPWTRTREQALGGFRLLPELHRTPQTKRNKTHSPAHAEDPYGTASPEDKEARAG